MDTVVPSDGATVLTVSVGDGDTILLSSTGNSIAAVAPVRVRQLTLNIDTRSSVHPVRQPSGRGKPK